MLKLDHWELYIESWALVYKKVSFDNPKKPFEKEA